MMTREQAIAFCKEKKSAGHSVFEILNLLEKAGYVNERTGEPLKAAQAIYKMLGTFTRKTRSKENPLPIKMKTLTDAPGLDRLAAVKSVLSHAGLSDKEMLNLIRAIVQ